MLENFDEFCPNYKRLKVIGLDPALYVQQVLANPGSIGFIEKIKSNFFSLPTLDLTVQSM
ncbi:hypothetical protein A0O36_02646 [Piscirickettsiaceae bacterium NZ-RLO1]|nr:hypothetical protein A0O36_02646 [Piscirickettsiaceae bacterium NZ-RLO1]